MRNLNRTSKQTIVENIMAQITPIVENAINQYMSINHGHKTINESFNDKIDTISLKEFVNDFIVRLEEGGITYEDLFDDLGRTTEDYVEIIKDLKKEIYDYYGGNNISRREYLDLCRNAQAMFNRAF